MTSSPVARGAAEAKPSAIVVGAGMAGLSAAFYLAERGFQVAVYEKEKTAGGNLGATIAPARQRGRSDLNKVFEVYPHMFGDWYNNFWRLMEAIDRGKDDKDTWRSMKEFKFLPKPQTPERLHHPRYQTLSNNGALQSLWSNLFSGIIPLPDMILAGYAGLGLMADDFKDTDDLNVATLNDFLNTRFYGSRYVTQFYQMIILYIWSLEPDESSVYACQRFFQYHFRRPTPTAWVLNSGDAYTSIIQPLVRHLESKWRVKFHFDTPVVAASLNPAKTHLEQLLVIENFSQKPRYKLLPKQPTKASAASYVFAVPPETLAALVQTPIPIPLGRRDLGVDPAIRLGSNRFGIITDILMDPPPASAPTDAGHELTSLEGSPDDPPVEESSAEMDGVTIVESASSAEQMSPRGLPHSDASPPPLRPAIVEAIPALATTKTLSSEPIPVLYIGFKKGAEINRLIPEGCYVGLTDSKYALTLVAVTNEFKRANPHLLASAHPVETIIALAASDYGELPIFNPPSYRGDRQTTPPEDSAADRQLLEDKSVDLLLSEASQYLPFKPADIEWRFFRENQNQRLFLNNVESTRSPVQTVYRRSQDSPPIIHNLAFAGDFCSQDVIMSTIEAAVESGIRAGMELAKDHPVPQGDQCLTLQSHSTYYKPLLASLKLMLMPTMVLVKSWSDLQHCVEETRQATSDPQRFEKDVLPLLLTYWPRQASMLLGATQDAVNTMTSVATESWLTSAQAFWSRFNRR